MGKTWKLGPNVVELQDFDQNWQIASSSDPANTSALQGRDLYRQNCRGCHGETGAGFVPEINSIIDPVRATSPLLIVQRMKNIGMSMSRVQAAVLAGQAQAALLQRIHGGGENMPAFDYLTEAEVRSLVTYLRELAGVPGALTQQMVIRESSAQIGEHIAKSLCHICHSAAGPNPTPEQLESGSIPPLATLTSRTSLPEFVRKVTHGTPIVMGNPPSSRAGRMPVFDYLTQDEVADVYFYLIRYPPKQPEDEDAGSSSLAATFGISPQSDNDPDPPAPLPPARDELDQHKSSEPVPLSFVIGAISFSGFLLVGGTGLTAVVCLRAANGRKQQESKGDLRPTDRQARNKAA